MSMRTAIILAIVLALLGVVYAYAMTPVIAPVSVGGIQTTASAVSVIKSKLSNISGLAHF